MELEIESDEEYEELDDDDNNVTNIEDRSLYIIVTL